MKLMRNREVQRLLLLCLLGTALIAAAGFCAGIVPGVLALAGGLVLSGGVMGVTLRRYRAIAQLNQDIDRVLHGEESLPIVSNDEGELAILRSEVGKMTIRLREAADSQRRERLHLADAMADISHQLRTPLTALNLTVTLLAAEDITPERRRELMRELRRLLSRMDWLVESLLKMSKLDAGTIPFQRMPLSAAELVRRAAAPLAVPMEVRGEHLETDVGGEMLLCDPGWTVEALGNVLKNCMEHAQSVVRVGARETALYTEITVRDDGPGMDPDDIPHLFERFYRGKNANQESFGIGLALSRAILAAQNGTIRAENAREGGALFTLRVYKAPIILFFLSSPLGAAVGRASLIAFFLFTDVWASLFYWQQGLISLDTIIFTLVFMVPMFGGMWFGNRWFSTVDEARFRKVVLALLMIISVVGLVKAL